MKIKIAIPVIFLMIVALIGISIIGPKYQQNNLNKILAENEIREANAQEEPLIDPDFYQKLKAGEPVNMLVIGDLTLQQGNVEIDEKWYTLLSNSIYDWYGSKVAIDIFSEENLFNSWIELAKADKKAYDVVFMAFTDPIHNEQSSEHDFSYLYENVLRNILEKNPKAEVIHLVDYSLNDERANVIVELSAYYATTVADGRQFIANADMPINELTEDENSLSQDGHQVYQDRLFNIVRTYEYGNKKNNFIEKEFFNQDAEKYQDMNVISLHQQGEQAISLNFEGSFVGVTYQTGEDHGIFDIYLDGAYLQSVDTYSDSAMEEKHLLISSDLDKGNHAITLQPSLLTNENATGTELVITQLFSE